MPSISSGDAFSVEDRSWRISLKIVPADCEPQPDCLSARRELVTITVLRDDYTKLKAVGGPHSIHIDTALRHYLNVIKETTVNPQTDNLGWRRGPVVSFLYAIPKHLSDEIRALSGRFDNHTIKAFHLFFLLSPAK